LNGRDFTINLNAFESGVLMGVIIQLDDRKRQALKSVYEQLVALKKEVEEEAGVKKEIIPGGRLKITDTSGNIIIREPYPWEVEGN